MTHVKRQRGPSVILSARVSPELAARLDFIVRNHENIEDRTQGVKDALRSWIEAREGELRKLGVFPPAV